MIKLTSGPRADEEIVLPLATVVIGRAEDCQVVIADGSVSGRHAEMSVSEFGVRVRDLNSTNGTLLDGKPVQESPVNDGQTLVFGSIAVRLVVPPVEIAIPELAAPDQAPITTLPTGEAACESHSGIAATRRCVQCGRTFCEACLHELRLSGGPARVFCPRCSGQCVSLAPPPPPKPTGLRGWIDTVRLKFKPPGKSR